MKAFLLTPASSETMRLQEEMRGGRVCCLHHDVDRVSVVNLGWLPVLAIDASVSRTECTEPHAGRPDPSTYPPTP